MKIFINYLLVEELKQAERRQLVESVSQLVDLGMSHKEALTLVANMSADLTDDWHELKKYCFERQSGSMELAKAPGRYVQALIMLGYCGRNDDFCCAVPNTVAIALGYYITGRWRKWAMLRKHIPWLNPVGFHNWTQEEYNEHLDYLDSLIGDV